MKLVDSLNSLVKALEAGNLNGAPGSLLQGSALQIQDVRGVMENVTFGMEEIKLQKIFPVEKAKSTQVRFKRTLSDGELGRSAQFEGMVGTEETGDYVEAVVPMAYYSHVRRVTVAANAVEAFDGVKAEDREAEKAAKLLAADVEFHLFQGRAHFSNAGLFDGNPAAIARTPDMMGLDPQIRVSDILTNTQDLMFAEYGSTESVVIPANGGNLTQILIEDIALRSKLNFGKALRLMLDPVALSNYNKIVIQSGGNITQFATMGQALSGSGADLRSQQTSSGGIKIEDSHFLRGKQIPARARSGAPGAPSLAAPAAGGAATGKLPVGTWYYYATSNSEKGEGVRSAVSASVTTVANDSVTVVITPNAAPLGTKYFNIYRGTLANGSDAKFIGRLAYNGSANVTFTDLGNKSPGFVNGYLIQEDVAGLHELMPYSRMKMGIQDLSSPESHFRFLCLAVYQPRKLAIVDGLKGSFR